MAPVSAADAPHAAGALWHRSCSRGTRFFRLLALGVYVATAHAADHPIGGDLLRLKDPPVAARRRVRFVAAHDPGIVPGPSDPRVTGATLAITGTAAGDGASGTVALPSRFWKALGDPPAHAGFRYLEPAAGSGIRKIVLRPGTLAIAGGGGTWPYRLTQPQGGVELRLRVGDDLYCASFTRFVQNRSGRLVARRAPPSTACAGGGPAPECGNGVTEPGEECDDANTAGGDGCDAICELELPCGDGILGPGEECDDDNHRSGDGCSASCALEACLGVPGVPGTEIAARLVVSGLAAPVYVTAPPGDPTRLLVVEQAGRVRLLKDGVLGADPFLDLSRKVSCCGEQGLLSVAFHPEYATNGRLFAAYTDRAGNDVVARYQAGADPDRVDEATEQILLAIPDFAGNHNGGQLAFGRDGYLYVSTGDGGGGDDPQETGQDLTSLLGKILRLDVDVDDPPYYASPATNPFTGRVDARSEIWAFGLRNPWRLSFDRGTGDLYVGDVGQGAWEEIDVQPAASPGGENYGWDVFEAMACHEPTPPATECPAPAIGFTWPVLEYSHSEGCSVTGGFAYRGCAMPDLRGTYFYADFCSGFVRSFRGVAGGVALEPADRTAELGPDIDNVSSFGEDARGELYIADYDGDLFEIVPAPAP